MIGAIERDVNLAWRGTLTRARARPIIHHRKGTMRDLPGGKMVLLLAAMCVSPVLAQSQGQTDQARRVDFMAGRAYIS
jgi:hypothetical protein